MDKITGFFLKIIEKLDNIQEMLKRKYAIDLPIAKIVGAVVILVITLFVANLILGIVHKFLFGY